MNAERHMCVWYRYMQKFTFVISDNITLDVLYSRSHEDAQVQVDKTNEIELQHVRVKSSSSHLLQHFHEMAILVIL